VIGAIVGSYRIVSVLGRGGMGVVYRAEHTRLGRPAALKMLQPHITSDDLTQRFFNEARAASAIDHPAIVEVFDYGVHDDGRAYLAMQLVHGETLTTHLEHRTLEPGEVASLMAQVADGLAAAHDAGIVHRDLKPDNIMLVASSLAPYGFAIKLLDFGIAKLAGASTSHRTQTGFVLGTPLYMSPEQCAGDPQLDHRTDLYSLGCIAYHALAGRPPFEAPEGAIAIMAAHLRDEPPDPRTFVGTIPDELVDITMRLLAKRPEARFASARALLDALIGAPCVVDAPRVTRASFAALPRASVAPHSMSVSRAHPTTTTRAAAEIISVVTPPARPSTRAIALGLGALAVVASVLATSRGNDSSLAPVAAATTPRVEPPPTAEVAPAASAPQDPPRTSEAPRPSPIALDRHAYARGARITVAFRTFTRSSPTDRVWLVIGRSGAPSPGADTWTLVEHGARRVALLAPKLPGRYEVRLYRNVTLQRALPFTVHEGAP
jgi:serine/threonine protein kinase